VGADCLTLNPLTATLLGVALLGEPIGLPFIAGGGIVVVGIVVAHGQRGEAPKQRDPLGSARVW
jgi:drug/metabolite transporter (DMT)-like permease